MNNVGDIRLRACKLAVVAAIGGSATAGAWAQSSVTFYGIADAFVGMKSVTTAGVKASRYVVDSDGMANSRWGVKGAEDLGGGLRAEFQLESLFDITSGTTTQVLTAPAARAPQLFSSQSWVGLSGGFGALRLGRQVTPFHSYVGVINNLYDATAFATTGTVWSLGNIPNYVGRFDNAVSYETPVVGGGFIAKATYGLGEDSTPTSAASRNLSLNARYVGKQWMAAYSYQRQGAQTSLQVPLAAITYQMIGGSYDLGMARIVGAYNVAKRNAEQDDEFQLGISVPIGVASIALGYAVSDGEVNGMPGNKGQGFAALGTYDLSKRTRLYAGWRKTNMDNAQGVSILGSTSYGVGAIHRF